jgi:gamma-glutamyltranspeptidase/glutathione hydrolase
MTFTTRPELRGTFGVVASTHWLASAAGMGMLEKGGNAFDAAVAAAFVLQVVEPHLNGPGGDVPIIARPAGAAEPFVVCGQGPSPAKATLARFRALGIDIMPGTGLLPACVPGAFGAWLTLLRDHGTMRLADVLAPAIGYARDGYPAVQRITDAIASVQQLFTEEWKTSGAIYLPGGKVPEPNRLFRNRPLADTYTRIVKAAEAKGKREAQIEAALDYWYRGPVAEAIDRFYANEDILDVSGRRHRGFLAADDLARWKPTIEKPLSVDYGRFRVFKCGPWSQGPLLLQALQILKGFDLDATAPASAEFVHIVAETLKLAMADRDAWYGDSGEVPIEALLSERYAAERRKLIGKDASLAFRPGAPNGAAPHLPPLHLKGSTEQSLATGGGEPTTARIEVPTLDHHGEPMLTADGMHRGDTCHVDVIDRWGNMVAATPSGGWFQSSPVVPELGFSITVRGQMFWLDETSNARLEPGKRPRTTLTPSMAFRDGAPYIAFGTPGGDQQDQWSLQLFLHHAHHGMNLQEAIDTPAFHTEHFVNSFWPREFDPGSLMLEGRFATETVEELERRGHTVHVGEPWSEGRLSACAMEPDGDARLLKAGANPRGMQGYAVGR